MSFISGLTHQVGNIVGGAAHGVGAAYDEVSPGNGTSSLTNFGKAVTNPNVTLTNPWGLGLSDKQAFTYNAPQNAPQSVNKHTGNVSQPTTTTIYDPAAAAQAAQDAAAYGLYTGQANSALGSAKNSYDANQSTINNKYDVLGNQLQSQYNTATNTYGNNKTTDQQNLVDTQNADRQAENAGYQSILRILGGLGAGGGSEAQYLVPQLATQDLQAQLSGAGKTFGQNEQQNDTAYNTFLNGAGGYNDEKKQQAQSRAADLAQNKGTYNTVRGELQDILSALSSHADTAANLGSQVASIRGAIPNTFNPQFSYTGTTPTYNAPTLSSYEAAVAPTTQVQAPTGGSGATLPYLALLAGQQKKQQVTPAV